jgi:uncharacterized protein with ParB-like and HNH nuclease domain
MKISSIDKDVVQLLNSSFYLIPRFQRPYSWDKDNVSDFWNDSIGNRDDDYFIGSFVVYKINENTFGIVDGQQRITTITILLCGLREAFRASGFEDLAEGIHQLIERKDISNSSKYVLQTETSIPYFQEYIQKKDKPEVTVDIKQEEKNLESANKRIKELINETINSIRKDPTIISDQKQDAIKRKLIEVRDRIIKLKVIFVELDNEDDAYLIFETLNTRGKDLSPADLLKNLLTRFIRPSNESIDPVKITWAKILNIIENAPGQVSIDDFIQHFWLSKYEYTSSAKLYKSIRRLINRDTASAFLKELESQAPLYRSLFEPTFLRWKNEEKSIRRSLEAINLFHVRQPLPLLLATLNQYKKESITLKETAGIFALIENFILKYTAVVTTQSTGGLSMMYSTYAIKENSIISEKDKNILLKAIKENLRKLSPTYDEYEIGLREIYYTNSYTKHRKLIKYILSKYHDKYNMDNTIDYDSMTIEHILPQSLIDNDSFSHQVIGNIGNLILVSSELNQLLDNKTFEEKKDVLVKKGCKIDPLIIDSKEWTAEKIEERFKRLAKEGYDTIWKI